MQTADFRNKLYLRCAKIGVVLLMLFGTMNVHAQVGTGKWIKKNNPNYDQRKLTYGFLIGIHSTAYHVNYSDLFVTPRFDTLHSVEPRWSPGFSLGFLVNYKLEEFFDLRVTPTVAFYEHKLVYKYTDDQAPAEQTLESTMVEVPVLLKYKSERRGNLRMYMVGGIKPGVEASAKRENVSSALEVTRANLSLDFGFGLDLYYPLFKFSPEIRFSKGMVDVLDNRTNIYGQPLDKLKTNTITVFLIFQ